MSSPGGQTALYGEAVRAAFGNHAHVVSWKVLTDGFRNHTAVLSCDSFSAPVFFKHEKPFSLPRVQRHQILREEAALRLCAAHEVPVPRLIAVDNRSPSCWILEEFLPGKTLSELSLNEEEKEAIYPAFDSIFEKLCAIRASFYGDTFDGGCIGHHADWQSAVKRMAQLTMEDCQSIQLFSNEEERTVIEALQKASNRVTDSSPPCLYHCDLFSPNLMGTRDASGTPRILAVIDFGMSLFAPVAYARAMTGKYCDLTASQPMFPPSHDEAYSVLRLEPLLMMKLYHYEGVGQALAHYLKQCRAFSNRA